ncbi:CFI-box-CTERM domain-containing protein [Halanaerobium sp. ST460_2HS_T2]|uniref:CFI-box-CTERM domain-containing protein n=1 Tax=Halanaerobium TaxID=2330 RepID=UPI000DF1CF05|nr:CFI-box-CTERM domain-containing protein [Halanaerobium sp. ST460_2HS_T2]RCW61196.1 hypothetical protein DFR80_10493 [Halanaerobium sp. ST460_2HS_T2]
MKIYKYFKNESGITLVEFLVTLGVIGIVGGLGTMVYIQANNAFDAAEQKWQVQTDMRILANFLNSNLRNAYGVDISPDGFVGNFTDQDRYIYINDNNGDGFGEVIYKDENLEKRIIGQNEFKYKIDWTKEAGDKSKVIRYIIRSMYNDEELNYSVDSKIFLSNMAKNNEISEINGSINGIYFKSSAEGTPLPNSQVNTFCFIATAAYGSPFNPAVKTLRMFRDLYLSKYKLGQKFIALYYKYSPSYAKIISSNLFLKSITNILLMPLVFLSFLLIIKETGLIVLFYLILLIIFAWKNKFLVKALNNKI